MGVIGFLKSHLSQEGSKYTTFALIIRVAPIEEKISLLGNFIILINAYQVKIN